MKLCLNIKIFKRLVTNSTNNIKPLEYIYMGHDLLKWDNVWGKGLKLCNVHSLLINPFKPEFIIVIFIHYKPRIAVAILDL